MQEPQNLIRIHHIPDPRIPSRVFETIAHAGEHEDDDEDGVRGMSGCDYVGG